MFYRRGLGFVIPGYLPEIPDIGYPELSLSPSENIFSVLETLVSSIADLASSITGALRAVEI